MQFTAVRAALFSVDAARKLTDMLDTTSEGQDSVQEHQERELRKKKLLAGGVLAAAAGVWFLTHLAQRPWFIIHLAQLPDWGIGCLRAAAEAGMVGGLADWFAVTALFRHPLSLPIPHTNLIPTNQKSIAEGVARYIDSQFLNREMIISQLRQADLAERLAMLFEQESSRAKLVEGIMRFLPRVFNGSRDGVLIETIVIAVRQGLRNADIKPIISKVVHGVVENDDAIYLIKEVSEAARAWLTQNHNIILDHISKSSSWYIPSFIDRKLADGLVNGLNGYLIDIQDPTSEKGGHLRRWLIALPSKIEESRAFGERVKSVFERIVSDRALADVVSSAWKSAKQMIQQDIQVSDSKIRRALLAILEAIAKELDSYSLRRQINSTIEAFLTENIPAWRSEIGNVIVKTLAAQQPSKFTRRLELYVGKDLQYIRMNGTIIGGLIGVAIYWLNEMW